MSIFFQCHYLRFSRMNLKPSILKAAVEPLFRTGRAYRTLRAPDYVAIPVYVERIRIVAYELAFRSLYA